MSVSGESEGFCPEHESDTPRLEIVEEPDETEEAEETEKEPKEELLNDVFSAPEAANSPDRDASPHSPQPTESENIPSEVIGSPPKKETPEISLPTPSPKTREQASEEKQEAELKPSPSPSAEAENRPKFDRDAYLVETASVAAARKCFFQVFSSAIVSFRRELGDLSQFVSCRLRSLRRTITRRT